jgi:peptidoglycan/LPS O-acetylase OafA/YrhL
LVYTPRRMLAWGAAALVLLSLAWITALPEARYWQSAAAILFWRGLVCAGFAALLACLFMLPVRGGWLLRPFVYLGEISYGIYLWHMPVLMTMIAKTPWTGWRLYAATLGATLMLAVLSWHGFSKNAGSRLPGRSGGKPRSAKTCYHCPVSMRIATSQSSKISSFAIFTRTPTTPGSCASRAVSLPIRLSRRFTCSDVHSLMMIWRTLR